MLESAAIRGVQELLGTPTSPPRSIPILDFQHLASVHDVAHPRAKRDNAFYAPRRHFALTFYLDDTLYDNCL